FRKPLWYSCLVACPDGKPDSTPPENALKVLRSMAERVKKARRTGKSKPVPRRASISVQDPGLRIAAALERLAPAVPSVPDFEAADAFVWHPPGRLTPITRVNRV